MAAFWPLTFLAVFFAVHGANMPYMPVWYEKVRGLSGEKIGLVLSAALMLRVVTGPVIAAWAEGLRDPRRGYALLSLGVVCSLGGIAVAPNLFWLIVGAVCLQTCMSSVMPFAEASTVIATRTGPISYGVGRAFGSAAFIFGTLVVGMLLGWFGPWSIYWWITGFTLLMAIAILQVPALPVPLNPNGVRLGFRGRLRGMFALLREPDFARIVVAAACIQASHAFLYSFSTLTWLKQGLNSGQVGLLWGVGVAAEIALLLSAHRFFRNRNPEALLLIGGLIAIARWALLTIALPFPLLVLVQCAHAGSFALSHLAAMQLLDRMAGDRLAVAQTLYFSLGTGAFTGVATLGAGWLYQHFASGGYGVMCAVSAIGVGVLLLGMRRRATGPANS
ncbi:MAG: MFS transporter [Caulobacterales bacterium]